MGYQLEITEYQKDRTLPERIFCKDCNKYVPYFVVIPEEVLANGKSLFDKKYWNTHKIVCCENCRNIIIEYNENLRAMLNKNKIKYKEDKEQW